MILLDTHVLVWFAQGNDRLGLHARQVIERACEKEEVRLSPISFWEAAMLVAKGRLALGIPLEIWAQRVIAYPGFHLAGVDVATALDAGQLPGAIHGDPSDRLLIATARALACPLMTADSLILAYAEAGHLRAVDARR